MGGIVGATSAKFVLIAATLLLHGRVNNDRAELALIPGSPTSAISAGLAQRLAHPSRPLKIGLRAEYFYADIGLVEENPAPGADMRIGRDLLDTHVIEIDFARHEFRLLSPAEARDAEAHMAAIPVTRSADGTMRVSLLIGQQPPIDALLDLSRAAGVTAPGADGQMARLGGVQVGQGTRSERPVVGLLAFADSRVIFDLRADRIWIAR